MKRTYNNPLIVLIIILSFVFSCKKNKETVVEFFPINDHLVSKVVEIPVTMAMALKIIVTENNLIVYDHAKTNFLKVFELPTIQFLCSWGHFGKGGDGVKTFDFGTLKAEGNNFRFVDFLKYQTAVVQHDSIKIIRSQWLRTKVEPLNGLIKINDSIYVFNRTSEDKFEHTLFNSNNNKQTFNFGDFNDRYKIDKFFIRNQFYQKRTVAKPDGERMAVFYTIFNKFKLYDNYGNLIKEIRIKNSDIETPIDLKNPMNNTIYNAETIATNNFIAVLNPNISAEESSRNKKFSNPTISIWNWNGNPIAKYQLDRPICSFAISEKTQKIYAVSSMVKNEIFEFNLPQTLINLDTLRNVSINKLY